METYTGTVPLREVSRYLGIRIFTRETIHPADGMPQTVYVTLEYPWIWHSEQGARDYIDFKRG